jgi:transposase
MTSFCGIDVAKAHLAIVLLTSAEKTLRKSCPNTAAGHTDLLRWLTRHADGPVAVGLEATGGYQDAVALALHEAGHRVSVLNPQAIAAYAKSQLQRAKTDPVDAHLIARYVRTQQPPAWTPAPLEARQLQALVRRLEALLDMKTQETNRLETAAPIVHPSIHGTVAHLTTEIAAVKAQIRTHIDQFPTLRTQHDLLQSIPGIGATTAAIVLGEILEIRRFAEARQLAAFAGLVPQVVHSGTSVRGRGALTPHGTRRLRKALYFPALTALRCNPVVQPFAQRLRAAGKPKMVVVVAVMRKLLHLIYGVLRSGRTFTPAKG